MTDHRTPGVYFQDVFLPPAPSLLTGVPAFLGQADLTQADLAQTNLGQVAARSHPPEWLGAPQRLTLWPQFEVTFGDAPDGFLPAAVRGFFENGGLLCYVVLVDKTVPTVAGVQRGLAAVEDLDDVDLICAPDIMAGAAAGTDWSADSARRLVTDPQRLILEHCRRRGERFAILDGLPAVDPADVAKQRSELAGAAGGFGALYYPWLWAQGSDGLALPPCGHLAGVYARSDRRIGVHKAPANEVVEGALDLQVNLAGPQVGQLYEQQVNCLRALPGRGIRVWGARTLSADPAWREVTARRLIGTISRWIERFMMGLVHEPNDVRLWVRIMRELTAYLDGLFHRGALKGRTADEAFFVKCDDETNSRDVRDAGMVVTQIGVAPTAPAEFIIVRAIHGASGVRVSAA